MLNHLKKIVLIGLVFLFGFIAQNVIADEDEQTWKINLKEAEIRAFITQVADITETSFVIDPRVKGKVTVISHSSLTQDEVYELFLSVLHVHNFAAVPSVDGLVKIVPNNTATKDTIKIDIKNQVKGEEFVTRVIPVKNTPANELIPVLRPMVAQHGHLAAVPSANAIIISDHGANIERVLLIIAQIDGAESEEIEVIQLKEAWVTDIVTLLESLTPVETGSASKKAPKNSTSTRVTVVADERTNRLILKGEKSARARVRVLVEKLDTPAGGASGSIQVVYLKFADAVKVAELLGSLITAESSPAPARSSRSSRNAQTPEDLTKIPTFIQADETLNALVIKADPGSMEEILEIVRQLDVRRAQVLIEAAIIEVKGDASRALGVQWGFGDSSGEVPVGGISFSTFGNDLNSLGAAASGAAVPSLNDGLSVFGGKLNSDGNLDFGAFLQAVSATTNTNILSTPSIVTLDNEEAEIIVGREVPITTGSTTANGGGLDNIFTTTERKDVGLTLKVVPQINEGDTIRLEIDQQTSDIAASGINAASGTDIITTKRSIKTVILAENKEYVVLGGLVEEDDSEEVNKVPILGDIPLLGALFRSTKVSREKTNLMVFLKPTIIRDVKSSRDVTDNKYAKVRELQLEIDKRSGKISLRRKELLPERLGNLWGEQTTSPEFLSDKTKNGQQNKKENKKTPKEDVKKESSEETRVETGADVEETESLQQTNETSE